MRLKTGFILVGFHLFVSMGNLFSSFGAFRGGWTSPFLALRKFFQMFHQIFPHTSVKTLYSAFFLFYHRFHLFYHTLAFWDGVVRQHSTLRQFSANLRNILLRLRSPPLLPLDAADENMWPNVLPENQRNKKYSYTTITARCTKAPNSTFPFISSKPLKFETVYKTNIMWISFCESFLTVWFD